MKNYRTLETATTILGLCARLGLDPRKGMSNTVPDWPARVETFGANTFEDVVRMMIIGRANEAFARSLDV